MSSEGFMWDILVALLMLLTFMLITFTIFKKPKSSQNVRMERQSAGHEMIQEMVHFDANNIYVIRGNLVGLYFGVEYGFYDALPFCTLPLRQCELLLKLICRHLQLKMFPDQFIDPIPHEQIDGSTMWFLRINAVFFIICGTYSSANGEIVNGKYLTVDGNEILSWIDFGSIVYTRHEFVRIVWSCDVQTGTKLLGVIFGLFRKKTKWNNALLEVIE